jgi:hypothetical protein
MCFNRSTPAKSMRSIHFGIVLSAVLIIIAPGKCGTPEFLSIKPAILTGDVEFPRRSNAPAPPLNALRVFEVATWVGGYLRGGAELGLSHGPVSRQNAADLAWPTLDRTAGPADRGDARRVHHIRNAWRE